MMKLLAAAGAAALLAGSAQAGITVSTTMPLGQVLVEDFSGDTAPGFTFTPLVEGTDTTSGIFTGSTPNVAKAPAGDTGDYYAVLTGGSATLTSTTPLTSLGLTIGSLDSYNTISFSDGATPVASFTGTQITAATGVPVGGKDTAIYDFLATGGSVFNTVTFTSSGNSFEFDTIKAGVSTAPEPSTWAMMFAGVALVGATLRLRRRSGALAA